MEEANLRKHFISCAEEVIALADYSKFGVKTLNRVCDIKSIDYIVTDTDTDVQMTSEMSKQGVKILVAENI